jgi:hypothetical protein
MAIRMVADDRLCQITDAEQTEPQQPKIICSLGLLPPPTNRL